MGVSQAARAHLRKSYHLTPPVDSKNYQLAQARWLSTFSLSAFIPKHQVEQMRACGALVQLDTQHFLPHRTPRLPTDRGACDAGIGAPADTLCYGTSHVGRGAAVLRKLCRDDLNRDVFIRIAPIERVVAIGAPHASHFARFRSSPRHALPHDEQSSGQPSPEGVVSAFCSALHTRRLASLNDSWIRGSPCTEVTAGHDYAFCKRKLSIWNGKEHAQRG